MGTENTTIAFLQPVFRHNGLDHLAGGKSHRYGKSVTNQVCVALCNKTLYILLVTQMLSYSWQRIEAWWSQLRLHYMEWWITFFKVRTIGAFCHTIHSYDFSQELAMNGFLQLHLPHHM